MAEREESKWELKKAEKKVNRGATRKNEVCGQVGEAENGGVGTYGAEGKKNVVTWELKGLIFSQPHIKMLKEGTNVQGGIRRGKC